MKQKDAQQSFEQLKMQLRTGSLKNIVLLYGEERYLRKQYCDMIFERFGGEKDGMNSHFYDGKNIIVGQIIDQAETMPLFADKRVMVLRDTGLFKSGGEQLAEYLENPCETAVFIFCESEVDERSKLYKAVAQHGTVAQIDYQTRESLQGVIGSFLKREGKMISVGTANRILDKTGTDMAMLRSELEKLVTYCLDKDVITDEDVDTICSENIEDRIFDMLDAIADKNADKTMELYYDLLALKVPPIKLLSLLEKQYNQLLQIRLLRDDGEQKDIIAQKMAIRSYFIGKYMSQASRYSATELKKMLQHCVQTDEDIKMGRISDVLGVETLLISLL